MSGESSQAPGAAIAAPAAIAWPAAARRRAAALARDPAARVVLRALVLSRVVVWAAGLFGALALGRRRGWAGFDPAHVTEPFGAVANALLAPAARWDSVWFLAVANHGYGGSSARTAFFPLYPLLAHAAGWLTGSALTGGLPVSLVAFAMGLGLVHRLAELELGRAAADRAVLLLACFPMSFFFSAVYSESLFLALSAGALLAARREHWALAGALGALGAATRSVGVVLVLPLLWIYLYGPRAPGAPRARAGPAWRPRHPLRPSGLWLALVPAGLGAYMGWLWAAGVDPMTPFHAQEVWLREFAGPFGAVIDGAVAAFDGARQLLSGGRSPVYFHAAGGDPLAVGAQNLMLFGFLALALRALAGTLRRLPLAYGLWCVTALALPLSYPVGPQPLMSLPRFLLVLFPLFLWAGAWAGEGRRRFALLLGGELALLAVFTALFARWTFVA